MTRAHAPTNCLKCHDDLLREREDPYFKTKREITKKRFKKPNKKLFYSNFIQRFYNKIYFTIS